MTVMTVVTLVMGASRRDYGDYNVYDGCNVYMGIRMERRK